MKKILMQEELLQWRCFQQISWQGPYKIIRITDNTIECILGHFHLRIQAEQLVVEQLHALFFCISYKQLNVFEVTNEHEE